MNGARVYKVTPGSPAEQAGIAAGDKFWWPGGKPEGDIIDYRIWEADQELTFLVKTGSGPLRRMTVRKDCQVPLGLQFDPPTIAPLIRCGNRCLFCFVDQNPPGLRSSLYLKDDDYRLSFLYGNYITLNNLERRDLRRIIKLQLSPLYISVHSADPVIRSRLCRNRNAQRGLYNLKCLLAAGIKVHAQIVLCPGYNLGKELVKTIVDLEAMGKSVLSVAVVPVGLTEHGQPPKILRRLTTEEASRVAETIHRLQNSFRAGRGSRFVFLADEIYHLAGLPYPETDSYEGYPQLENGVGMARLFMDEISEMNTLLPVSFPRQFKITLITGVAAGHLLEKLMEKLAMINRLEAELITVENRFFGPSVTVAGLLTGKDLKEGLQDLLPGEALFFPAEMLKDGDNLFLDGLTPGHLERVLHTSLIPVAGPMHLARKLGALAAAAGPKSAIKIKRGGEADAG